MRLESTLSDGAEPIGATRNVALDLARGIGILFVVFGHAWRGAFWAGLIPNEQLFRAIDGMIYAWHMPLFFLLSGLVFVGMARAAAPVPFVLGRVRRLIWPFLLWTWIFFGFKLLAGGSANTPVTLADAPLSPLPPYEHLWFLWALFLLQLAVYPFIAALWDRLPHTSLRIAAGVLALIWVLCLPYMHVPSLSFGAAVEHLTYFLAGIALGGMRDLRPPVWAGLAAAVYFVFAVAGAVQPLTDLLRALDLVLAVWIAVAALAGWARPDHWLSLAVQALGRASLAIFLAHTIFSAALRIALLQAGVTSLPVHLILALAAGLIGPMIMLHLLSRLKLAKLFGL